MQFESFRPCIPGFQFNYKTQQIEGLHRYLKKKTNEKVGKRCNFLLTLLKLCLAKTSGWSNVFKLRN